MKIRKFNRNLGDTKNLKIKKERNLLEIQQEQQKKV